MRLVSWNVNGIRAALKKGFMDWFNKESPDICCIQEIKASEENIPAELKNLPGYSSYFNSALKPGYSGVATFSKVAPQRVLTSFGDPRFDTEGRVLISEYDSFALANIYFPNGKASAERLQYKMDFYDAFLEYCQKGSAKPLIICGDVNTAHKPIDLARPKENEKSSGFLPQERAWMDVLINAGYVDSLRLFNQEAGQYTWWDQLTRARERNVGWRIDYFFVSEKLRPQIKSASIQAEVMGSDHCPIWIDIDVV